MMSSKFWVGPGKLVGEEGGGFIVNWAGNLNQVRKIYWRLKQQKEMAVNVDGE